MSQPDSLRNFVKRLAELEAPIPRSLDVPMAAQSLDTDSSLVDPDAQSGSKSVSADRLARLFSHDQQEHQVIATAFRRILTGQHTTMEYREIVINQLVKILQAAQRDAMSYMYLQHLLRSNTTESREPISEEIAVQQNRAVMGRISKLLAPDNPNLLRGSLERLNRGERLDPRRVHVLVDAFDQMLEVFERHPDLLAAFRAKKLQDEPDHPDHMIDSPGTMPGLK